jgi:phosphoribosylformylglycinamidine synthase
MVGLGKIGKINKPEFQATGDVIMLLGNTHPELGGSSLFHMLTGETFGLIPQVRYGEEKSLQELLLKLSDEGLLQSATDISDGGLAQALIECTCESDLGATITLKTGISLTEQLFSESTARALVTANPSRVQKIAELANALQVPMKIIGVVGGAALSVSGSFDIQLEELKDQYKNALRKRMSQ